MKINSWRFMAFSCQNRWIKTGWSSEFSLNFKWWGNILALRIFLITKLFSSIFKNLCEEWQPLKTGKFRFMFFWYTMSYFKAFVHLCSQEIAGQCLLFLFLTKPSYKNFPKVIYRCFNLIYFYFEIQFLWRNLQNQVYL